MAYIVYHIKSTVAVKYFSLESGARRSVTCSNRNADSVEYAYATEEVYNNQVVTKRTVRNLMTGKEIQIDSNTPRCCDPSTESYWSM
jgi:hypothetical protein